MKKVYLVFEGDERLSTNSLVLMGVYDDKEKAIGDILDEMAGALLFDDDGNTSDYAKELLEQYDKTQGFRWNYIIQETNINEWGEI